MAHPDRATKVRDGLDGEVDERLGRHVCDFAEVGATDNSSRRDR